MAEYSRPASGFRFRNGGMRTNQPIDALPADKHAFLQNVRSYVEETIQSRPQLVQSQAAPAAPGPVLALEATQGLYKIGGSLLVAGNVVDSGYSPGLGCSIVPFRPNASPNTWDYVFDKNKSSKVNVNSAGTVVVQKAGIAEPQSPPDICPDTWIVDDFTALAASWANGGTAGATSDTVRVADVVGAAVIADPASVAPSLATRYSVQVGTASQYQVGMMVAIGPAPLNGVVADVLPSISTGVNLTIQSISYFSGTTGRCIIVPNAMPVDNSVPDFASGTPVGATLATQQLISSLRRGSLIRLNAAETVFVLSVSRGPSGKIAIETSTTVNHVAAETITGIPAISFYSGAGAPVAGMAIAATAINFVNAVGTGTITATFIPAGNPFVKQSVTDPNFPAPQQEDYLHLSLNISDLTLLSATAPAIRIMFDVNNGAANFTDNYFYYEVRPNDILAAVTNTQTQLAASQVAAQRQAIDINLNTDAGFTRNPTSARVPTASPNISVPAVSSGQTDLGSSQWSEIMFPILALTRVGNDETRTLSNCQAARIQIISTNNVTVRLSSIWVGSGGAQPDIGSGELYFYRVRPRNKTTGAFGNPSPSTRYGVNARRQRVIISLPSSAYDSQIDTWDVFRQGGQIFDWRMVGSIAPGSVYVDNVFDTDILLNESLGFRNYEPFPSIGPPISTTTATIVGTLMTATFPLSTAAAGLSSAGTLSQLGSLLPGNLISVGPDIFTLYARPTLVSTAATTQTYLFQLVENAGSQTNPLVIIQEPLLAAQPTEAVFGPDMNGVLFSVRAGLGVNNGLRPGVVQWTNANDPDSASDANTKDICPPSEPLLNGEIMGGYPVVVSASRAWRGISRVNANTGLIEYDWTQVEITRGLAAPEAVCSDGRNVYYVASDGIRQIGGGESSLTDADLSNLFPHEGLAAVQSITYAGNTVFAPEYTYAANFRLGVVNDYLYFDYLDRNQNYRTLVCNLKTAAWNVDVYATAVSIHVPSTLPASNNQAPSSAVRNQILFVGDTTGAISIEQSNPSPNTGESISCVVATREETFGDIRANKVFGDAAIDLIAASAVSITPVFLGSLFGTVTVVAGGASTRPASPPTINLNGEQLQRTFGLNIAWIDRGQTTILYSWQPTYITQPPDISNQFTDWDSGGTPGNKFVQGFQIELDTLNAVKNLVVRDSDTLTLHDFTSDIGLAANQVQANGQRVVTCSFNTPFKAHLMRIEPTDTKVWRLFRVSYIYQDAPSSALTWVTQGTSFGIDGYLHAKEMIFAYVSTAPVTLTVNVFDGLSPSPLVLPSTAGIYQRLVLPFSPNKGLIYTFNAISSQPFQVYLEDCACKVKPWGSAGPYQSMKQLGGSHGIAAAV